MFKTLPIHFATLLLALAPMTALADADQAPRQLTAYGKAERVVAPDKVRFDLQLEGRGSSAEQAMNVVGAETSAVLATVQRFVAKGSVDALNSQLREVVKGTQRSWRRDSGEPMEMLASRRIHVQRLDLDELPDLISALAPHKLARLENIQAYVEKEDELQDELLLLAIDDAHERARKMAQRLKVKLGLPLSVHPQQNQHFRAQPKVMMSAMAMESDRAGGGYEAAADQELSAQVTIVFELEAP